ncbi:MAG: oxidoreductase [Balneola sp.]|nr:MAG: oxidoreductase [Balneola sp.]
MKTPKHWNDYELLDFGDCRKLERFGSLFVDRPEPSALVGSSQETKKWSSTSLYFNEEKGQKGNWNKQVEDFTIEYPFKEHSLKFWLSQGTFKHLGVFPEQAVNWEFLATRIEAMTRSGITPKVLNLFAYTGGASMAAALSGAKVTHVDSSKSVVNWARKNAELNGLDTIRWIVEDARSLVEKSIRRGDVYHGIIMDPPIFGMGSKGKNWKLNRDLAQLIENSLKILDHKHRFFVLNTYSPQLPKNKLDQLLKSIPGFPSQFESVFLGLKSSNGKELSLGNLIRF